MKCLRTWMIAGLAGICCMHPPVVPRAYSQPAADLSQPLNFRRVLVPNQRFGEFQPAESVRYRPIRKSEFDRLVQIVREHPAGRQTSVAARLTRAVYTARLAAPDLLTGEAELQVECGPASGAIAKHAPALVEIPTRSEIDNALEPASKDSAALALQPQDALLPLAPWGQAIHHAHWGSDRTNPAILGFAPDAPLSALVEGSGTLQIEWSLRSARGNGAENLFSFQLPASPISTLWLELPADLEPRPSKGVTLESQPVDNQFTRWRIELGGASQFTVALASADDSAQRRRLTLLRQSATYEFSARGVDLTNQLTLEVHRAPLRQLSLLLDPGLKLLVARQGDIDLAWSEVAQPKTGALRVTLEFPEPILGSARIRLQAVTPAQLGTLWRLPGIQVDGVLWQEGKARLLIPEPLSLDQISLADCRQSSIDPLAAPLAGESLAVQFFNSNAAIDLRLSYGKQQVSVTSGTRIDLGDDQTSGQVVAELRVDEGQVFSLRAAVAPHWTIDSVESDPPGRVKEFSVSSSGSPERTLQVELSPPLDPDQPLRLVTSGRRSAIPPNEFVGLADMRMIEFSQLRQLDRLMAVRTTGNSQLRVRDVEAQARLDPRQLSSAEASLFLQPPAGELLRLDAKSERLAFSVEHEAPQYHAETQVDAMLTSGPLWETTKIQVSPQNAPVQKLRVQFSQSRAEEPVWSFGDDHAPPQTAKRVDLAAPSESVESAAGETWELTFPQPMTSPFMVRAMRVSPGPGPFAIDLVSLPDAAFQQGRVAIRAAAELQLSIENRGLTPIPAEASAADPIAVRGAYRYRPEERMPQLQTALEVRVATQAAPRTAALIWSSSLDSRYEPGGRIEHLARFCVQNFGQSRLELKLPPTAAVLAVWVDEQRAVQQLSGDRLVVPLPAGRRFPSVTVHFALASAPQAMLTQIKIPELTTNLPSVARRCRIWLPPGYQLADDGALQDRPTPGLTQRLFGTLARTPEQPRFDPAQAAQWQMLAQAPWASAEARQQSHLFLTALGAVLNRWAADGGVTPRSWHMLIAETMSSRDPSRRLLVDSVALAASGFSGDTLISSAAMAASATSGASLERGIEFLDVSQLVILVRRDSLILTTRAEAARQSWQLIPLEREMVYRLDDGPLAARIEDSPSNSSRFVRADDWKLPAAISWPSAPSVARELTAGAGWSAHLLPSQPTGEIELIVLSDGLIATCGWSLFLLVVIACGRRDGPRFSMLLLLASATAAAALLLPAWLASVASYTLLALLVCLLIQVIRATVEEATASRPSTHAFRLSDLVKTSVASAVFVAAVAMSKWGQAEDPPDAAVVPLQVHQVLVPVDADGNFDGTYYHVTDALYKQLRLKAAKLALQPQGWLLERADYRVELLLSPQQKTVLNTVRLDFDLRIFDSSARVRLPLDRDKLTAAFEPVLRIEGREVAAAWESDGRALTFMLPAGRHRGDLLLKPQVAAIGELQGFDLPIPALATARVEVLVPRSSAAVEIPSALGAVTADEDGQRFHAALGPAELLSLRWRESGTQRGNRPSFDLDQLAWLKIQPGAMVVNARLKVKVIDGSLRELQFAADPRLQLLSLEGPKSLALQTRVTPGSPQLITVEFARPVSEPITLETTLWLTGTSGVGNLRMPQFDPQSVRTLRRMAAVSIDSGLDFEESGVAGLPRLTPAEFLAQWGNSDAQPQIAYRLPSDAAPTWGLLTRPRRPKTIADQSLAVDLFADRAELRFEAVVTAPSATNFQYRVLLPAGFQVDRVSVIEDNASRLARFAHDPSGPLTIFLTEAAAAPQQLAVHGFMPVPTRGNWSIPAVELEGAERRSAKIVVRRQPDLLAEPRQIAGLVDETERVRASLETGGDEAERGRLVGAWSIEQPSYGLTLQLSPNRPRFEAVQRTTVQYLQDVWQVTLDCRIRVRAGSVDRLLFEVPDNLGEPIQLTPAAPHQFLKSLDGLGRQLVVRPIQSLRADHGEYRLTLSAPLGIVPGSMVQAPVIRMLGPAPYEQSVVLPTLLDRQPISWETRGLIPADAPAPDSTPPTEALRVVEYQVVDEKYLATMQTGRGDDRGTYVRLGDLHVVLTGDRYHGLATFDLIPAGAEHCPLTLPEGISLLQVTVGGEPALFEAAGKNNWSVALYSPVLPQSIEVMFAGQTPPRNAWQREQRITAPSLGDIEVERTLWTVHAPAGATLVMTPGLRSSPPLQQELMRARALSSHLESVSKAGANHSAEELTRWYRPMAWRLEWSLAEVKRQISRSADSQQVVELTNELNALRQQELQIAQQLGQTPALVRSAGQTNLNPSPRLLWEQSLVHVDNVMHGSFEGSVSSLGLQLPSNRVDPWLARGGLAAALLAGALGLVMLGRLRPVAYWRPWGPALIVLLGVTWWLWLVPSAIGLVILILGLLSLGKSFSLQFRNRRRPAYTIS